MHQLKIVFCFLLAPICLSSCFLKKADEELLIPPAPQSGQYIYDAAALLKPETKNVLVPVLKETHDQYNAPLYIVTIRSTREYGNPYISIHEFSKQWFNKWNLTDKALLFLVSLDDQEMSIVQGKGWAQQIETRCREISEAVRQNHFAKQDFSVGIERGALTLIDMIRKTGK